jgi:hypothetical protein
MANYLPHFAEAYRRHKLVADQKVLLNTITNSHNFNFTNIVFLSLRCGALFNASSIKNSDFLIFAFLCFNTNSTVEFIVLSSTSTRS